MEIRRGADDKANEDSALLCKPNKKGGVNESLTYPASYLAERGGFEPPVHFWAYTRFPVVPFRPLRHLSYFL